MPRKRLTRTRHANTTGRRRPGTTARQRAASEREGGSNAASRREEGPPAGADLAKRVMASEGVDGSVALAFVDEAEMAGLNERFRGASGPTDVLSFNQADDDSEWPDPTGRSANDRGEVVVCPSVVARYAMEDGGDPGTQLGWTILHGMLHLLGYDHEKDDGEMRERERLLLRELDPQVRAVSRAFRG